MLEQKEEVGRALGQTPDKIGSPISSERNIDSHRISFLEKPSLNFTAKPVNHLKFKLIRSNFVLGGKATGMRNKAAVMGYNRQIRKEKERYSPSIR